MKSDMEDDARALTLRIGGNAIQLVRSNGPLAATKSKADAKAHTARRAPNLITIARIVARASAHSALAVFICP